MCIVYLFGFIAEKYVSRWLFKYKVYIVITLKDLHTVKLLICCNYLQRKHVYFL